jgi:hypothetical protein
MLGLSSGIITPQAPSSRQLIGTHTADWSSGVDNWTGHSNNDGTWNFTRIASFEGSDGAGGTVTKNNVLQVDVTADETGFCGIQNANLTITSKPGDYIVTTFDIYLDSTQGGTTTDRWNGSDDVGLYLQCMAAYDYPIQVEQDKWASISTIQGATLTNASLNETSKYVSDLTSYVNNDVLIYLPTSSGDLPRNGARLYLANFVVKHYRSQLFT